MENPKNMVDDQKEGHQKFWAWKWKFFPKKTSSRNLGPRKNFRPPNSAPGLRHWTEGAMDKNHPGQNLPDKNPCEQLRDFLQFLLSGFICTTKNWGLRDVWRTVGGPEIQYNWVFLSRFNKNKSCTRVCLCYILSHSTIRIGGFSEIMCDWRRGSKLVKNSVTYFMDGIVQSAGQSLHDCLWDNAWCKHQPRKHV